MTGMSDREARAHISPELEHGLGPVTTPNVSEERATLRGLARVVAEAFPSSDHGSMVEL